MTKSLKNIKKLYRLVFSYENSKYVFACILGFNK